jgi:4-coumarate--CoA ligase
MPQQSPYQIDIPATDILSYVYPEGKEPYDQPIWIDADNTEKSLSPKQALGWIKRLGLGLDNLKINRGEVVMMFSTNHIFCPVAYLGVAGSGRVFSGTNPAYTVGEISYQITNTGAKIILVDPALLDNLLKAADQVGFPHDKIYLFLDEPCKTQRGIKDWSSFLPTQKAAESWQWHRMSAEESSSNTAVLNYSSGTTGLPKGVRVAHQNIIANVCQSLYMRELSQSYPQGQKPPERFLGFLPL